MKASLDVRARDDEREERILSNARQNRYPEPAHQLKNAIFRVQFRAQGLHTHSKCPSDDLGAERVLCEHPMRQSSLLQAAEKIKASTALERLLGVAGFASLPRRTPRCTR